MAIDPRQVTLGLQQGALVLESIGQLVRITRQVGLLAGETIPAVSPKTGRTGSRGYAVL
jgi:hypothetical protein